VLNWDGGCDEYARLQLWEVVSGQLALSLAEEHDASAAVASQLLSTAMQSPNCTDNVTVVAVKLNQRS
jgi:serine/threonine protein phosphatase PrpC